MPNTQTANYGPSILAGGASGAGKTFLKTDASLILTPGGGAQFPTSTPFYILISNSNTSGIEILKVTAVSGDIFTVARAQQNTPAISWSPNSRIEYEVIAGNTANLWSNVTDILTSLSGLPVGQSATAVVIASSDTITTAATGISRVNPAGAVTGVIMQVGTLAGQIVVVVNESANSVTMALAGTSHVADGTSSVIAANTASSFIWNTSTSLWYHMK